MCGISGMFVFKKPDFQFRKNLRGFIDNAMYVGSLRGRDSTGIMAVNRDSHEVCTIKQAVDGAVFMDKYNVGKLLLDIEDYSSVVVHNRKATMGSISDASAHPFTVGDITLVHNGTLYQHKTLGGGNNLKVDSEAIAYALNKHHAPDVLEDIDGAFTLVWHDSRNNTLSIARNKERPLSVAFVEGQNTMLFCSEALMLEWLAARNGLKIGKLFSPAVDTIYTWDLSVENPDVTSHKQVKYEPTVVWEGDWYGNSYRYRNVGTSGGGISTASQSAANAEYYSRTRRERALEKFSLKVGDVIPFLSYGTTDGALPSKVTLNGIDEAYGFEVIAYMVDRPEDGKSLSNCLCKGRVLTVKDTDGFPEWITVVVGGVEVVEYDYSPVKVSTPSTIALDDGEDELDDDLPWDDEEETSEKFEYNSLVTGPKQNMIPYEEWNQLTKEGCSNCGGNLTTPSRTFWTHNEDPLCEDCIDQFATMCGAGYQ